MIRHHLLTPASPSRVVILGASGFIGKHLANDLHSRGVATLRLASADLNLSSRNAGSTLHDLLNIDDALVFSAALTPDRGNDVRTLMDNLAMVESFIASDRLPCSHIIYLSSDAVYDSADGIVRESVRPAPSSLYGHMHFLREHMIASAAQRWGCPLLVLRPCAVYGSGDTHNSYGPNRFLRSALAEQRILLFGNGEEMRDHLLVTDLVRLIGCALQQRSAGLLNVAPGRSLSFHALSQRIVGLLDHSVAIEPQPRRSPITHRHFDVTELIRGFPSFRFTDLSEGLRAIIHTQRTRQAA